MHGALQELQPSFSGRCGVQHTDFSRADLLSVYRALRRVKRSRHERVTHVYQLTLKGWVLPDACEELTAAAKSMCEGSVVVSTRSSPQASTTPNPATREARSAFAVALVI